MLNPMLVAFVLSQYQVEAEARAYDYRVGLAARRAARLAKTKIPSRLPWYWRWRYLGTRVSFRRRYATRDRVSPQ